MTDTGWWLVFVGSAYLLGSIPFGLLIGLQRGVDLREHGSGNIGATNARRVLGPGPGSAVLALDVAKGAAPVLIAGAAMGVIGRRDLPPGEQAWWLAVAAAGPVGHMFPVWLRLRGGKGVATGFGALVSVWPALTAATLAALAVWFVGLRLTRLVGVASSLAALALPIAATGAWALLGDPALGPAGRIVAAWPTIAVTSALALVVIAKHRVNLRLALEARRSGRRGAAGSG